MELTKLVDQISNKKCTYFNIQMSRYIIGEGHNTDNFLEYVMNDSDMNHIPATVDILLKGMLTSPRDDNFIV